MSDVWDRSCAARFFLVRCYYSLDELNARHARRRSGRELRTQDSELPWNPMKCVILQPSYIPWRGYFHQIYKSDLFIFYDDVAFDKDGWRNRNRIKTASGVRWLTIPVTTEPGRQLHTTPINLVRTCQQPEWKPVHWRTLQHSYSKAPHFRRYAELLELFYQRESPLLCEYLIQLTMTIAAELGIKRTRFRRSSEIGGTGTKTDRLINILTSVGATHYISGPAAKDYLNESKFRQAGISLEYMTYDYPEYEQLHPPFDPQVSVLDLLFMAGPDAPEYIWGSKSESVRRVGS